MITTTTGKIKNKKIEPDTSLFGDEPPADLYLICCIKSWFLHILRLLRGHTIQHWSLPDSKSSTVNKPHHSWTILRPNPTQLKTVKQKKFKNFDRSLFQKLRKKKGKRKTAQITRLSTSVHHYHYQNNFKNYIRRKPRPILPCDAPARRPQVQQRDASMYVQHPYYKYF